MAHASSAVRTVVDAGMLTSILDTSAWRNLLSQLRSSSRPRDRALILIRLIVVARGGGEVWERALRPIFSCCLLGFTSHTCSCGGCAVPDCKSYAVHYAAFEFS